jgi:homoserine kinase
MSASLLGNFVIAYKKEQEIIARSLRWPADWDVFAVVPSYSVKTSHSRSILPDRYTKQDVIENIQRVSLITAAIIQADATLLRQSMGDRLHEPFRIAIVPELKSLREALKDEPIMGCVLSGAGSSMLVIVEHSCKHQIQDALSSWAKKQSCAISVIETSIDTDGLTIMSEQI